MAQVGHSVVAVGCDINVTEPSMKVKTAFSAEVRGMWIH
jgi:hypothetical protein